MLNRLQWVAPAECRIPPGAVFRAMLRVPSGGFRERLRTYLGVSHCVVANSGRTLLYLLLASLRQRDGGERKEVALPGFTCYSVAASAARASLRIRPYDLDPGTLQVDMDSLMRVAGERTLAIVVQHLFGVPTVLQDVRAFAQRQGIWVVEDCAQGLGGRVHDLPLGTVGDFGLFSFGRGKPLPLGGGGALVSPHEMDVASTLPEAHGWGAVEFLSFLATQVLSTRGLYGLAERLPLGLGRTVFDPDFVAGALPVWVDRLGAESLPSLASLQARRSDIAQIYRVVCPPKQVLPVPPGCSAAYPRFPLMAGPGPLSLDLRRLGVRRMYPNALVDEETMGAWLAEQVGPTPGARDIARRLLSLPTHGGISPSLAETIATRVREVFP